MNRTQRLLELILGTASGAVLGLAVYVSCSILSYGLGWFSRSQVEIAATIGPVAGACLGLLLALLRPNRTQASFGSAITAGLAHSGYLMIVLGGFASLEVSALQFYFLKGIALSAMAGALMGWFFETSFVWMSAATVRLTHGALSPPKPSTS